MFVGKSFDEVDGVLTGAGLVVNRVDEFSAYSAEGNVISVTPTGLQTVAPPSP